MPTHGNILREQGKAQKMVRWRLKLSPSETRGQSRELGLMDLQPLSQRTGMGTVPVPNVCAQKVVSKLNNETAPSARSPGLAKGEVEQGRWLWRDHKDTS